MTAVGELVLVLGLLASAHCEVRARDPDVKEDEEELGGRGGRGGGVFSPHPGATESPPLGEMGNHPARTGNWCAFVQKRVLTKAVACGTERYTIKSQSPCPSGTPDCHLTMYKLSTRPMYKQQQQIFTVLLWRCCPGYGGHNCEDTAVAGPQLDSESSALIGGSGAETAEVKAPAVHTRFQQQQRGDPNREQNDHQASVSTPYAASYPSNQHSNTHPTLGPGHSLHNTSHQATNAYDHHQHPHRLHHEPQQHEPRQPEPRQHEHRHHEHLTPGELGPDSLPYFSALVPLLVPYMMDQVWSKLQPVMEGFNRSLEHLSQQVGVLARDVAHLKSSQLGAEHHALPLEEAERDEAVEEHLDARLDKVFENIRQVQRQMEDQRTEMENRLHSQHAMLHYNLTSFKMDIDMKLKHHQKMLQVSLQAMNTTVMKLKLDQGQISEEELEQEDLRPPSMPPHQLLQTPTDTSALWEAIERLDNTVVNNTLEVTALMEDVEVTSGSVEQLSHHVKELEKLINNTARRSQVLFMETGLEVEAAKVTVLKQVNELAGNLSQQDQRLHEVEEDMEYMWPTPDVKNKDCDCEGLKAAMACLERDVANVTEQANENRLALEENSRGGQWGVTSDWEPAVKALQLGLQGEQSRIRTLDLSLTQLNASVSGLKETDKQHEADIKVLSSSFTSLHHDAIRHSRVLELLLDDDPLIFAETINQEEEEEEEEEEADFISIPALRRELQHLQEQLRRHEQSIVMLQDGRTGGREEVLSADQPSSSWLPGDTRGGGAGLPASERQLLLHPGDGGDLWKLERTVEEMEHRLAQLEEKPCPCPNVSAMDDRLQNEVMWLKKGLEEHLRVFKNVFSNADVLRRSDATLELDKLWQLLKNKEKKRGGRREESGRDRKHRSRRESPGERVPSGLSERSLLFVARSPRSVSGSVVFEPSLNRVQFYSDHGTFTAPVDGIYLFVLTLHLKPGPAHVVLRRRGEEEGGASASLQRQEVNEVGLLTGVSLLLLKEGEELRVELREGEWAESEDNVFAGLLLHPTT